MPRLVIGGLTLSPWIPAFAVMTHRGQDDAAGAG